MNEVSLERLYGVLKTYDLEQIQQKKTYGKGRVVSTSTAVVAEVPQKVEEKIVQSSGLNKDAIISEYGVISPNQSDDDFYSLEKLEQLEDESMALTVKRFGISDSEGTQTSSSSPTSTDSRKVVLHLQIAQGVAIRLE